MARLHTHDMSATIHADDAANATVGELGKGEVAEYREPPDLELDWLNGKLSDADYEHTPRHVREEAGSLAERTAPGPEGTTPMNAGVA